MLVATLQLKAVPEDLHARLRERAKAEHMTMRDYVLRLIENDLDSMSLSEWGARIKERGPIATGLSSEEIVEMIRRDREERGDELLRRIDEPRGR